jgi:hypothetical protein
VTVDVRIGSVNTNLTAVDPAAIMTPEFRAVIVAAVREDLERERHVDEQRSADQAPRTKRRL